MRLIDNGALTIMVDLAKEVDGADGALILQGLYGSALRDGEDHFGDGLLYVQISHPEWAERAPWMTPRTIRRVLDKLKKAGHLEVQQTRAPFANWYAVNLPGQNGQAGQNGQVEQPVDSFAPKLEAVADGVLTEEPGQNGHTGQNGQDSMYKEISSSLTDTDTKDEEDTGTSTVDDTASVTDTKKRSKKKKGPKKVKFYDYRDYQWDKEVWAQIREGNLPEGHNSNAVLVGAYLVSMNKYHPDRRTQIAAAEFGGRLSRPVSEMLAYFVALEDGDAIKGLNAALDYVIWFTSQEENDFIAEKGWPPTLCFAISFYRDAYNAALHGRRAKNGRGKSRKGALGLSDSKWLTLEQREKYINDDTVEEYSF